LPLPLPTVLNLVSDPSAMDKMLGEDFFSDGAVDITDENDDEADIVNQSFNTVANDNAKSGGSESEKEKEKDSEKGKEKSEK